MEGTESVIAEPLADVTPESSDMDILNEPDAPPEPPAAEPVAPAPDAPPAVDVPPVVKPSEVVAPAPPAAAAPKEVPGVVRLLEAERTNPALKELLGSNPELRNQVYRDARLAQDARQYNEIFASLDLAKSAKEGAEAYGEFQNDFYNADDPKAPERMLDRMWDASLVRGPDGKPVLGQDGQPKSDGSYARLFGAYLERWMPGFRKAQAGEGDQKAVEALDYLIQKMSGQPAQPDAGAPATDQPPPVDPVTKAKLDELDRIKGAENERISNESKLLRNEVSTGAITELKSWIGSRVEKLLPKLPNLSPQDNTRQNEIRARIVDDVFRGMVDKARGNRLYQVELQGRYRTNMGTPEGRKAIQTFILNFAQRAGANLITENVQKWGGPIVQQQIQKVATLENQAQRKEPQVAGGGITSPSRPEDEETFLNELQKMKGAPLSSDEILYPEKYWDQYKSKSKKA
jgi:hypothetical protein